MRLPDSVLAVGWGIARVRGERVVQHLASALNEQALYGPSHPAVFGAGEEIAHTLSQLLAEEVELRIALSDGGVLANGQPVPPDMGPVGGLIRACARHGIGQIVFRRGATAPDVTELLHLLGKRREELGDEGGLAMALATRGIRSVACETFGSPRRAGAGPLLSTVDASLLTTCTSALEVIQESAQQARLGRVLNASAARDLASQLADNVIEDRARLLSLLSIRRHDEYTFQHSLDICILALALGMAMGLSRARLQELGLAALLHDVGKAWVPLEVLRKPGPLDEEELALIRRHPVDGAVYLGQQLEIPPAAAVVAFQHHLRYDQRGYPTLRWPRPPNAYSLIVGIADAYEALTSERPYRPTRGPEEALRVMLETAPGQFEPRLLRVFAEMLGRSDLLAPPRPVGIETELASRR